MSGISILTWNSLYNYYRAVVLPGNDCMGTTSVKLLLLHVLDPDTSWMMIIMIVVL